MAVTTGRSSSNTNRRCPTRRTFESRTILLFCGGILLILSVCCIRFSSANLPSSAAAATIGSNLPSTTRSTSSWNPPIRIGVQSKRNTRPTVLANIGTRQYHYVRSDSKKWENEADALLQDESVHLEDDIDYSQDLLRDEETTYASCSSISRNVAEESRGFRNSCTIPSLNIRREKEGLLPYNNNAQVVRCAAVAVSSKTAPASFSSNIPYTKKGTARQSLNKRKDASNHRQQQQQQQQAVTTTDTGRPLVFWENMICGAISRSIAQTVMHPANTLKTILQQNNAPSMASMLTPQNLPTLMRGAGANFVLSVPHGAVNFAVLEMVRKELARVVKASSFLSEREQKIGPALDFMSSAISTICCSVVSTPQMMITDNIMAGNYPNLPEAVKGLAAQGKGLSGFYARGWWPGLVGKIPSYALTWTFFQQLKQAQRRMTGRDATNAENSIMGCMASGATVCIMIPMDTIKTRLVTQASRAATSGATPYKGILDCAVRVAREEGIKSFYKGLPPRLVSVVPMIGLQFGVYEFMKKVMQKRSLAEQMRPSKPGTYLFKKKHAEEEKIFDPYSSMEILEEAAMEVAASPEHPYPAPYILKRLQLKKQGRNNKKNSEFGLQKKRLSPATSNP